MAEACPLACKKETIDTDISFTLMSEESARRAFKMWGMPANRTKDDVVFMELFFKTLDTEVCSYLKQKEWGDFFCFIQVTKFDPFTIMDLLSSIGGTLGLFLGGSIFSLFEFMLIAIFFCISMSVFMLRTALKINPDK